ncbi:SDR family NAD(P)-dependent oxidoreductase [Marinomonas agarivorans]|nr:SDR family NAD(P)-dependent oxidoreductase [Marinomonas agarivorans]
MKRPQITGETIWITGASAGIGLALAKKLCQHNTVIISGRHQDTLDRIVEQHPSMKAVVFDVTDKAQISTVQTALIELTPYLDRVILNAGNCEYFSIDKPDWLIMERMMQVNFLGMVHSVQASLELLKQASKQNKLPHIVGIGSQAIQAPFTKAEGYGASKAAVSYWLDSLRIDLAGLGIDVSEILPGFVDTRLTQKNDFPMPFLMSVDEAAERIIKGIVKRPLQYAFPKRLTGLLWLARRFPRRWMALQQQGVSAKDKSD